VVALPDGLVRACRAGARRRRRLGDVAIAYRHADVALVEATSATTVRGGRPGPMAPALQARNHAATPPSRP